MHTFQLKLGIHARQCIIYVKVLSHDGKRTGTTERRRSQLNCDEDQQI